MIYLLSRAVSQGPMAGIVSLAGTAAGFLTSLLCAAFGITAIFMAAPFAYQLLKVAGAIYLGWLAWQAIRPGGQAPLLGRELPKDPPRKLGALGFLTNLLNPMTAVLYLSLLPQFIAVERGSVFKQSLWLGGTQIGISVAINSLLCIGAGSVAIFFAGRPTFALIQRWLMASVLGALAVRMATEPSR